MLTEPPHPAPVEKLGAPPSLAPSLSIAHPGLSPWPKTISCARNKNTWGPRKPYPGQEVKRGTEEVTLEGNYISWTLLISAFSPTQSCQVSEQQQAPLLPKAKMKTLPQGATDSASMYSKVAAHRKGLRHTKPITDPGRTLLTNPAHLLTLVLAFPLLALFLLMPPAVLAIPWQGPALEQNLLQS